MSGPAVGVHPNPPNPAVERLLADSLVGLWINGAILDAHKAKRIGEYLTSELAAANLLRAGSVAPESDADAGNDSLEPGGVAEQLRANRFTLTDPLLDELAAKGYVVMHQSEIDALRSERFFALRRTDGEQIGEYTWLTAADENDWAWVEEDVYCDGPVEYEIVEMNVRSIAKRTFGDSTDVDEEEPDETPAAPVFHFGRHWEGHQTEDECPCPQEPCGLISAPDTTCPEHGLGAAKTLRQGHRAQDCPGAAPVDHTGDPT